MQNPGSVFFLFFPMVGELDRTPVGDVPGFALPEYSVEHSCGTEQADMSAMKRCEWPPFDISQLGERNTAGLSVSRRLQQQVLYLIQRNPHISQYDWLRVGKFSVVMSNMLPLLQTGPGLERF